MTYTPKNARVTFGYDYYDDSNWVGKLRSRDELNLVRREVKKKMASLVGALEDDPFHYVFELFDADDPFDEEVAWQITEEHLSNVRKWAETRWSPFGSYSLEDCRGKTCTVVGTAHITGTQFELHELAGDRRRQVEAHVVLDETTGRAVDVPLFAFISYDCEPDGSEPAAANAPSPNEDVLKSIFGGGAVSDSPNVITSEDEEEPAGGATSKIWPPIGKDAVTTLSPDEQALDEQPLVYSNLVVTVGYDYVRGDWIQGLTEEEMDLCRIEAQRRIRCDLTLLTNCDRLNLEGGPREIDAAARRVEADREAARDMIHKTWGPDFTHLRAVDPAQEVEGPVRARRPLKVCTYNCVTKEHRTENLFEVHRAVGNTTTPIQIEVTLPSGKVPKVPLIVSVEYDCRIDPKLLECE